MVMCFVSPSLWGCGRACRAAASMVMRSGVLPCLWGLWKGVPRRGRHGLVVCGAALPLGELGAGCGGVAGMVMRSVVLPCLWVNWEQGAVALPAW